MHEDLYDKMRSILPTASRPEQNGWMDQYQWLPADAPPEREALTEGLPLARQCLDHRPRPAHHRVAVVVPSTVLVVAMAADGVSIRHICVVRSSMSPKILMQNGEGTRGGGWPAGQVNQQRAFMVTPAGHPGTAAASEELGYRE